MTEVAVRVRPGGARSRLGALLATLCLAVGVIVAGSLAGHARGAIVQDVTCNSFDNRIYFQLPTSGYDQWLWYRLYRLDAASGQWVWYFDAPSFYLKPNWVDFGTIGGGGGPAVLRNDFLTYVTVDPSNLYYAAAFVAWGTGGNPQAARYEWVSDYSNVDYFAHSRQTCWIG